LSPFILLFDSFVSCIKDPYGNDKRLHHNAAHAASDIKRKKNPVKKILSTIRLVIKSCIAYVVIGYPKELAVMVWFGLLLFNGTFSTKRLYCAMIVVQCISRRAGEQHNHTTE